MSSKMFAYVGNWNFHPADKGISCYKYFPEDGSLELIETIDPEVCAGQIWLHPEKPILYVVNEKGDLDGKMGGGGYVMAYSINTETNSMFPLHAEAFPIFSLLAKDVRVS